MPEPLGLEMLAAALPGHDVRILDQRFGDDLAAEVRAFQPDLVGVTALTPEVYAAAEVLRQVKAISPDIFTVVGGHHASLLPRDFHLPQVDAIIIGEGEPTLAALVAALERGGDVASITNLVYRDAEGRFVSNPGPPAEIDLDSLPIPRRDLAARHRDQYFFLFDQPDTSMATGRGCPYRCSFCSVWEFYHGRTRMMSPQRVISELKTVATEHITFVDDNFLLNHQRESAIADMIRAEGIQRRYSMECRTDSIVRHPELVEKWVKIGLYAMLLGLEGADTTLKSVGKRTNVRTNDRAIRILQGHGVVIWGAFIVDPSWQADDFKRLRDYVTSRGITHTQFTVLTPLPGTELYRHREHELLTRDYTCFDVLHAVTKTRLEREDFYHHFADLYRQTDLRPYFEMVRSGKLTIENMKRGKDMLAAMSRWENYIVNDPILGRRAHLTEFRPGR
jgi:radical SAM superfamily enzyme YgiQ (UPF0313 family)